jgi:cell volume regulation protein A
VTNRFFKNLEVGNVVSHTKAEKNFFSEIVFILKIFFFIYLGISIDFSQINAFIVGGIVVVLILVARWSTAVSLRPILKWSLSDARQVMSMFPRGLAAAILASVPMIQGIEGSEEVASIVNYTVFLSIILTSVMIFWTSRHGQMMESAGDEDTVTEASKK